MVSLFVRIYVRSQWHCEVVICKVVGMNSERKVERRIRKREKER